MPAFDRTDAWLNMQAAANVRRTLTTIRYFVAVGLEPILIKGWSIARLYDREFERTYTDIDVAFDPAKEPEVLFAIRGFNQTGTIVDVHFGLKGLDTLDWQAICESTEDVLLDGTTIRVLCQEGNLRLTAVHWLTDGGVNKGRLRDIYYLVKNRKADFDWERCLDSNGPTRKTWVIAAIATARDHLNLDVSALPIEIQQFQLPNWYKKTLEKEWNRGPYIRRVMWSVVTRPKLLVEQLKRRFPPNRIAATIDTETPIDNSSRIPAQIRSLTNKIGPFARGIGRRLTYSLRREHS